MSALLRSGTKLRVVEAGEDCPLQPGENVTTTGRCTLDFLAGGDIVAFEVRRSARYGRPTRVMIQRGSRGASFTVTP